jgi:putative membrane protein
VALASGSPYSWSLEPQILAWAAVVGGAYGWRLRQLQRGGERWARRPLHVFLRAASFYAGLAVLALAFISPVDRLGEQRLFCMHMVQHLMIADIAPILLLLGLSRPIMRPLVRRVRPIEQSLGIMAHPLTALLFLLTVMWAWHIAAAYELTLHHVWAHELEHASFFIAGTAFWWYVIEPVPPRHRLRGMAMVGYITGAKLALAALGVVLAFSPTAFYSTYRDAPRTWGLTPLEDLNIGGLVMMIEQTIVLVSFFAILFVRMLEQSERDQQRRERFEARPG